VFSTGYVDHIVDMASITNNITSAIYANNPPHLNEATHQILGDYINRVMGNGGMGADSDTQGAFYGTGPVISSGYVAGGSYGGAGQIGVQENNLGGSWFAQVYHAGGTDYPWTSMGGTNTYNVIESLQGSFGSGRSRVMTKDMVIGWNSVFSYSGLGPIIESVHAGLSEDQTNGAQINAGQSGTAGDQSGGLGFSWLHTALSTANTGSCASGFGGQWSFGADGTMTRCPSGGGSWTAFGGSGGTYTGTSPIVVTGAVISCPTCSSSGIAPTTLTIATSTQAANSCTAIMGFTLTGVTTSGAGSIIEPGYQSSPSALTGWGSTGGIVLHLWPSAADTVGGEVCNQTASSITYSAITFTVGAR
jgi:hypothetical protein